MTTITKTTAKPKAPAAEKDATALLRADHAAVIDLFADYEKTRSDTKKKALVAEICTALSAHAQIEEEIFYPAVKAALKDKLLVPEATVEHSGIKDLKLSAALLNLFDKDPPFTWHNVDGVVGAGWDPRVADPRGRTLQVSMSYDFK